MSKYKELFSKTLLFFVLMLFLFSCAEPLAETGKTSAGEPSEARKDSPESNAVVSKIAAGALHSLILLSDGTVWIAGIRAIGQEEGKTVAYVGDNNWDIITGRETPKRIAQMEDVIDISAGGVTFLFLKSDGTVWVWGIEKSIVTEDGQHLIPGLPVQVSGLSDVKAISGRLTLKQDGTVWARGSNRFGQLGDGTQTDSEVPVQVPGIQDAIAISAGSEHSLILKADKTVWGFGGNSASALAPVDPSNFYEDKRLTPVPLSGFSDVTAIAAGAGSFALKEDGTVWYQGYKASLLNPGSKGSFTQIASLSNIKAIDLGGDTGLALTSDGKVWSWGVNTYGQLGDDRPLVPHREAYMEKHFTGPALIPSLSDVVAISSSGQTSLFLKADGTVWATGRNDFGQLGDGTREQRTKPVQMIFEKQISPAPLKKEVQENIVREDESTDSSCTTDADCRGTLAKCYEGICLADGECHDVDGNDPNTASYCLFNDRGEIISMGDDCTPHKDDGNKRIGEMICIKESGKQVCSGPTTIACPNNCGVFTDARDGQDLGRCLQEGELSPQFDVNTLGTFAHFDIFDGRAASAGTFTDETGFLYAKLPLEQNGCGPAATPIPLTIERLPPGTTHLAIEATSYSNENSVVEDPLWTVWNIPVPSGYTLDGAGNLVYSPPVTLDFSTGQELVPYSITCPEPGVLENYFFSVIALDQSIKTPKGSSLENVWDATIGHYKGEIGLDFVTIVE